jgi:hypothetical protein
MSRFFSLLEKTLLPVAALISLAASLGDLSGFFRMLPSAQFSFLLLMITLLALGTAGFIQNRCAQIGRALVPLSGKTELNNMNEMIMQIDLNLRKVWGDDYFARMGNLLQTAIEERRVEVNDFSFYFKQLLRAYPGATFLSTSSLSISHLWTNREVAQALTDFIRAGGRVKQIFFVKSLEDESSVEMRVALAHLEKIGVSVQIADYPCDLKNFFFVEARRRIAWEIPIDRQGRIGTSVVTADERTIARYVEIFSALWKNGS